MTIKKRFLAPLMVIFIAMGMLIPTTAYAYASDSPPAEEVKKEETTEEEKKEEAKPENALTPEGNLTLVDDVDPSSSTGKQFVTLVSKNGNYFYLIIDRDDKGNSTVHFLNQVDEADLMSLMEKDDVDKLQAELEKEKEPAPTEPVEEKVEIIEKHEEPETINLFPIVLLAVVIIGGGVFAFIKFKQKKKAEETKPDPDADYVDDEYDEEDDELEYFDIEDEEESKEENKE
ncbi:DUF4366 domain-containing protein [Clostridium sp. C45]|uniref:DUF4366 domain-containing protein n=1 Tax=Clostridium sp. 10cd* TaxID=3373596 RepID=UPI0037C04169